jgi:hypothetical protein
LTTARSIIEGALGFGLNRLSPGETLDADTASSCLTALNMIADEFNGSGSFLFRDLMTQSTAISAASAALGTAWSTLTPGTQLLDAIHNDSDGDEVLTWMPFEQYQAIFDKTTTSDPEYWSFDGYANVYFYPIPTAALISLRTRQTVSNFADLDTDYGMPSGYKSALSDLLAEKMAFQLLGQIPPKVARDAAAARRRLLAKNMRPAIIQPGGTRANIITGP